MDIEMTSEAKTLEELAERYCQHKPSYTKLRGTYYTIELDDLRTLIKEVVGEPVAEVCKEIQCCELQYTVCIGDDGLPDKTELYTLKVKL